MDASGFEAIESAFASLDFPPHVYWPDPEACVPQLRVDIVGSLG
jgi:hypothetical protein